MEQSEFKTPSKSGIWRTPGACHQSGLQALASCTYLKLFDTGAGIIGEALGVRNLDVLTVENPGQVVSHLPAKRGERVGACSHRTGHFTGVWEAARTGEVIFSTDVEKEWVLSSLKTRLPPGTLEIPLP